MMTKQPVYIPFEGLKSKDGRYTAVLSVDRILFNRRNKLGLKQREVAEMAHIPLRQYQILEAGQTPFARTNAEFALAVCIVLLLDPYELIKIDATPANPSMLQAQHCFDVKSEDIEYPQHFGKKPIQRDIMTVYLNHGLRSIVIPGKVLETLGKPSCISMKLVLDERRLLICRADATDPDAIGIHDSIYKEKDRLLDLPAADLFTSLKGYRRWNDSVYSVECRLVENHKGVQMILCDLNTARPATRGAVAAGPIPAAVSLR